MDPLALRNGLILFLLLGSSICLRAYAQAWMANALGDRTPALEGRLTLNPLPHVDLLGTVVMPLICIFYFQPALNRADLTLFLGWAKPVPVNPHNFRNPRGGAVLVAFAGLFMGVLLCLLCAVGGGVAYRMNYSELVGVFGSAIAINTSLMVFDILPVPPLPGGVLLRHLGYISEEAFVNIARWSGLVLIILINLRPTAMLFGLLRAVLATPFYLLMQMIGT